VAIDGKTSRRSYNRKTGGYDFIEDRTHDRDLSHAETRNDYDRSFQALIDHQEAGRCRRHDALLLTEGYVNAVGLRA